MQFSLILATKGRTTELGDFLESLKSQSHSFEVIVIDQNEDERLNPTLEKFCKQMKILHLRSKPGLSRARNVGLRKASGEIISFPDDDCEYPPGVLEKVADFFDKNVQVDGLSGKTVDREGIVSAGQFGSKPELISKKNIWRSHNSVSLFLRSRVVAKVGKFDEEMGLGAFFSSSEETDYVIRLLQHGYSTYFEPRIEIYHPRVDSLASGDLKKRGLNYGRGVGRLLRKHPNFFTASDYVKVFLGPLIRGSLSFSLNKLIFNLNLFRGRVEGYLKT